MRSTMGRDNRTLRALPWTDGTNANDHRAAGSHQLDNMKILYDHQAFETQKVGGISRYFCEIMERLRSTGNVHVELALKYSANEYLKHSGFSLQAAANPHGYENFLGGREFRGKWTLYKWRNRLHKPIDPALENKRLSIAALRRQDFDVFHPTYYDDYFLPYIGNKPFVLTVHDMIHEIYPEYFNLGDQTSRRKRNLSLKAAKIIAISECTKKDLIDFFDIPPEKIQVIHHGNSIDSSAASLEPHVPLPDRYLLFVGSRSIYKNFYFFVNSAVSLMAADPTLHIVCAGSAFDKRERTFFELRGIDERMHSHSINDAGLRVLYSQALAFVFPSLYEGFGLPVLEAFSSGCPVVLANAGSLPEVGGDAAVYFEPKSPRSMRAAISEVLYSKERRLNLIERGRSRLGRFSWEQTSRETASLYLGLSDHCK